MHRLDIFQDVIQHKDAQFSGYSFVPIHLEMMGFIGMVTIQWMIELLLVRLMFKMH